MYWSVLSEVFAEKSLTSSMVFSMKAVIQGRRSFEEGHSNFEGALYKMY